MNQCIRFSLATGVGLLLIAPVHPPAYAQEAGWQQARIQHVLKARKLMKKERERKREQKTEQEQNQDLDTEKKDQASEVGHS